MLSRFVLPLALIGAVLAVDRAAAAVIAPTTTYTFAGTCEDCTGTAAAELTLQNYALGDAITTSNFVSFHYDGTNLFAAFTIAAADVSSVSGSIDGPLPAPETFSVSADSLSEGPPRVFASDSSGYWCVGYSCLVASDFGYDHLWSGTSVPPPVGVPEPMSAALLGGGLFAALAVRRRRG